MNWRDHIISDPEILVGKPTIKGTRLSVELILGWLAQGWTHEMLIEQAFAADVPLGISTFESEELK